MILIVEVSDDNHCFYSVDDTIILRIKTRMLLKIQVQDDE